MIDIKKVIKLVEEKLGEDMFLVDISVNNSNAINVFVDGFDGMTIEKCIEISRNVENNLDREEEDFSLQVSSPGLTESFKVKQQYFKYKDRDVEILSVSDESIIGKMIEVTDEEIVVETSSREKVEGHKKKQLIVKQHKLKYDEIKSAKAVITFK